MRPIRLGTGWDAAGPAGRQTSQTGELLVEPVGPSEAQRCQDNTWNLIITGGYNPV